MENNRDEQTNTPIPENQNGSVQPVTSQDSPERERTPEDDFAQAHINDVSRQTEPNRIQQDDQVPDRIAQQTQPGESCEPSVSKPEGTPRD